MEGQWRDEYVRTSKQSKGRAEIKTAHIKQTSIEGKRTQTSKFGQLLKGEKRQHLSIRGRTRDEETL